jgi:cation transport ATPase
MMRWQSVAANVDRIVTDKTGTLSKGRPRQLDRRRVAAMPDLDRASRSWPLRPHSSADISHPIAHAFRAFDHWP